LGKREANTPIVHRIKIKYGESEWWKNNPEDLIDFMYFIQKKRAPTKKDQKIIAWKSIVEQLSKKYTPPEDIYQYTLRLT